MSLIYLFYYFCKYNIKIALPLIKEEFEFNNFEVGLITSSLLFVYCIGQFINGWFGDKYGPRKIVSIGGIGSVLANFLFSMGTGLSHFIGLWGLNGYFSSMGWSPGCRLIYNWFPNKIRGTWIGIYNAFCYAGGAIVFPIAGWCAITYGWRSVFQIPPLFLLAMTFIFLIFVRNSPKDIGIKVAWMKAEKEKPSKEQYRYAFTHKKMNFAYAASIATNFVRYALLIWVPMYLFEETGLNILAIAIVANMINIGGAAFSVVIGVITDKVFKGERWQIICIGFVLSAISIFAFGLMLDAPIPVLALLLFLSGGLIQGIQSPLFNIPGDLLGRKNASTGAGIMDGWMYVGAILTGFGLGYVIDSVGFTVAFYLMGVVALIGAVVILPLRGSNHAVNKGN